LNIILSKARIVVFGGKMEQVRSFSFDHHGLVAGTCDDLGLIEKINQRIGSQDCRRVIQPCIAI